MTFLQLPTCRRGPPLRSVVLTMHSEILSTQGHSRTASEPSTPALESPTNGQSSSRGKLHTAVTTAGSKIQNLHNKVYLPKGLDHSAIILSLFPLPPPLLCLPSLESHYGLCRALPPRLICLPPSLRLRFAKLLDRVTATSFQTLTKSTSARYCPLPGAPRSSAPVEPVNGEG